MSHLSDIYPANIKPMSWPVFCIVPTNVSFHRLASQVNPHCIERNEGKGKRKLIAKSWQMENTHCLSRNTLPRWVSYSRPDRKSKSRSREYRWWTTLPYMYPCYHFAPRNACNRKWPRRFSARKRWSIVVRTSRSPHVRIPALNICV